MTDLPFIVEWARRILPAIPARRRALDLAMGRGRHAVTLAGLGLRVFGVDASLDAVRSARARAAADGLTIAAWCGDLTITPLPRDAFDLIVVARYLQRDLFAAIRQAVAPGGFVLYETFTTAQRALDIGPTSAEHLLEPGELRERFEGFKIVFSEEVSAPEAVARLVARRRGT